MRRFILTLQFLTRIPINIQLDIQENDFAKGIIYFPVIGLIIGLFNGMLFYGTSKLIQGGVPILCYILGNVLITGALHVDGLADTCDGLFSARKKERMLEIMRDSRVGTNGVIAILFDFLFRYSVLSSLSFEQALGAIILSSVAGRTILGILMYVSSYARKEEGLGGLFLSKVTGSRVCICSLLGTAIIFAGMKGKGILLFILCLVTAFVFKAYTYSKIQGMTGDTLGAANEIVEIIYILACILI